MEYKSNRRRICLQKLLQSNGFFVMILFFLLLCSSLSFAFEEVRFVQELTVGLAKPVDVAIDRIGNIFVLDKEISKIFVFDKVGKSLFDFGQRGSEAEQLSNPESIAISPLGHVIIADTGNNCVQVYDLRGKFLFQFGSSGSLNGQFKSPHGVVVDQFGFIFVTDRDNRRIQVFTPNGVFMNDFETEFRPVDLSIDPKRNLYVLIPEISKIVKYSPKGQKLNTISCVMNSKNYILESEGIVVDSRGDIYITDNGECSIKKFDEKEKILISFGSKGEGRGQFDKAKGMTTDAQGQIYIADTNNRRVQIFKIKGTQKKPMSEEEVSPLVLDFYTKTSVGESIVGLYNRPGTGLFALSEMASHIVIKGREDRVIGKLGKESGEFFRPMAIHITLDGKIYVADTGNHRIQIFKSNGELDYRFGKNGAKAGQFSSPQGIIVNSKGKIYVADTQNHRVQIFTNDGIYLNSFGEKKFGKKVRDENEGELHYPKSLAIDSHDRIFVLDYDNTRIQVFDARGKYLYKLGSRGTLEGQFERPSDIAIDENDYLYVADQGNNRIQIFDPKGAFVLSFGSLGEGKGYFKELSSITVSQGKIYVGDYRSNDIQVFRYSSEGMERGKRIYATKTIPPPKDNEDNDVVKYSIAKKQAIKEAETELMGSLSYPQEYLKKFMKLESVEMITNGQVKVTVSLPREIPPVPEGQNSSLTKGGVK